MSSQDIPGTDWILKYYQGIKDGSICVGQWVRLLYEQIVSGINSGQYIFDQKKANSAVDWIEEHCFHTEGPLGAKPLKLALWQKALVSAIFGIVDENGTRQFREVLLLVARKNGKSVLAAAIAKYEWWVDGGYGARVYTLAPKLDQAEIIYSDIWQMVQLDPEWQARKERLEQAKKRKEYGDDPELARHRMTDLYLPVNNGTVKKIAFSAKKSDGFNPSLCICDEIAAWEGDKGLKQYEVMKSGMGARPEAIMLSCTASGYSNDSIYDELIKRSTRFLLGDSKEKRLLPFLYMIDDIEKWNDINELRKANPNMNVSVPADYLIEEISIAEGSLSKRREFITKYACLKQNSSSAMLSTQVVERATGEEITLESIANNYAVCGLDLSQTTDLTSACVVVERGGELYVVSHFWLPAEKIDEASQRDGVPYGIYIQRGFLSPSGDNYIDYHDVYDWLVSLVKDYEILPLCVGYDRWSSQYLVSDLKAAGYVCDDVNQGENLYGVLMECRGLLEDGKIRIGDNDLLKIHMLNAAIKMSVERGRGKLVKLSPGAHIDGFAALIDALTVRQKWYAELGDRLKNEG